MNMTSLTRGFMSEIDCTLRMDLGDCLDIMANLLDNSVDLVLCDLPYGTTRCKWDVVIPFEPMWEQIWRIGKPDVAVCLFGAEPFSSSLRMSQLKWFKYSDLLKCGIAQ